MQMPNPQSPMQNPPQPNEVPQGVPPISPGSGQEPKKSSSMTILLIVLVVVVLGGVVYYYLSR